MFEPLKTERLFLRRFREEDRAQTVRLLRNEEISRTFMIPDKCGFHFLKESIYKTHYGTVEKDILNVLYREEWENGIR